MNFMDYDTALDIVHACEKKLSVKEDGAVYFVPAAAIGYALLASALCKKGDNVIISSNIYGGRPELVTEIFHDAGAEVIITDTCHPCHVEQSIDDSTRAIIAESIFAPDMAVSPLEALVRVANRQGVPLIVDNTTATPVLCNPIRWGAHIVIHSTLDYMAGAMLGDGCAVIDGCNFDWAKYPEKYPLLAPNAEIGRASLSPIFHSAGQKGHFDRYFLPVAQTFYDSLNDMYPRMEKFCANGIKIAQFLEKQPQVLRLMYPGLPSHPHNDMANVYFPKGTGGMMSFSLKGGAPAIAAFIKSLHRISADGIEDTTRSRVTINSVDNKICFAAGVENSSEIIEELTTALKVTEKFM